LHLNFFELASFCASILLPWVGSLFPSPCFEKNLSTFLKPHAHKEEYSQSETLIFFGHGFFFKEVSGPSWVANKNLGRMNFLNEEPAHSADSVQQF